MATFSSNGMKITFTRSIRREMLYGKLLGVLVNNEEDPEHGERFQFACIAPFVDSIEGSKWIPPTLGSSDKAIVSSYNKFMNATEFDISTFNQLYELVRDLRAPLADVAQRKNEDLTEAEKADPK